MKRHLITLLLVGVAWLPVQWAQAQDKPVLNSAPPAPRAPQPQPVPATPAPQPATAPAPESQPAPSTPEVAPSPDSPSGLNFPNRENTKAGGAEMTKKFLYTNLGLGYTSVSGISNFNASLSPAVGFRLNDKLAIGPGLSYSYNSYSLSPEEFFKTYGRPYPTRLGSLTASGANSLSSSSLGIKFFAQYIVYQEFFLHAEYEVTNAQLAGYDNDNYLVKINKTVTSPLAGVGYRSTLGDKAALDVVGLYNFGSSVFSLYPGLNLRFSLLYNIGR